MNGAKRKAGSPDRMRLFFAPTGAQHIVAEAATATATATALPCPAGSATRAQ